MRLPTDEDRSRIKRKRDKRRKVLTTSGRTQMRLKSEGRGYRPLTVEEKRKRRGELRTGSRYELHCDDAESYFHLIAADGEVILTSYAYPSKDAAMRGILSAKDNACDDIRYLWKTSRTNEHYFVLETPDGVLIGKSEKFASEAACDQGIESVKKYGPVASFVDQTSEPSE